MTTNEIYEHRIIKKTAAKLAKLTSKGMALKSPNNQPPYPLLKPTSLNTTKKSATSYSCNKSCFQE
jgi:hypothetical protein